MAEQFDPYATITSKEDNPLSFIDSAPTAASTANHLTTNTNDNDAAAVDQQDSAHDENSESSSSHEEEHHDDEDYPMDYLDTEGWDNRRRAYSSSSDEDEDTNESSDQQGDTTHYNIGGTDTTATDNRYHRRGLFPSWRKHPSKYKDDTADNNYSALPNDTMDDADPPSIDNNDDDDDAHDDEHCDVDNEIRPGDHIYVWQAYGINPRAYQRHAVVFRVDPIHVDHDDDYNDVASSSRADNHDYDEHHRRNNERPSSYNIDNLYNDDDDIIINNNVQVTVVTFYQFQRISGTNNNNHYHRGGGTRSGCQTQTLHEFIGTDGLSKKKPIHKVRYGAKLQRGILNNRKHVVGTALKQDAPGLVLARIRYLLDHPNYLPKHNALSANGECAAMWCVTGRWCTLQ
eukprot:scaffold30262_cov22-Cyclotella_meneghiniana.AAC.1